MQIRPNSLKIDNRTSSQSKYDQDVADSSGCLAAVSVRAASERGVFTVAYGAHVHHVCAVHTEEGLMHRGDLIGWLSLRFELYDVTVLCMLLYAALMDSKMGCQ